MTIKSFINGGDNSLGLVRDIRAEFGGTPGFAPDGRIKQASISQYYRGGTYVPNLSSGQNNAIPTAGLVQFSNYYGTKTATTPPLSAFTNGGFESGTTIGWEILNQRIFLNGGTIILGYPTPTDPNPFPTGAVGASIGDGQAMSDFGTERSSVFVTTSTKIAGSYSLQLNTGTHRSRSRALRYGPAIYSANPVIINAGSVVTFWYAAAADPSPTRGDAYNLFVYMLNPINGATINLMRVNGVRSNQGLGWTQVSRTFSAGEAGIYHFVFVGGCWDSDAGTVLGAYFYVDEISVT
jgi:hypothetical protein